MANIEIPYMCRVVEDYIYHRTDKRVKVTPLPHEVGRLVIAYNMAIQWFNFNNIK